MAALTESLSFLSDSFPGQNAAQRLFKNRSNRETCRNLSRWEGSFTQATMPSRRHILLFEANRDIQAVIGAFFAGLKGFELHTVTKVNEAIGITGRQQVDAAIVDLSDLSSVQARLGLIRLWRSEQFEFPVTVTSAQDYDGLGVEAFDSGADDFVRKPYLIGDLFARIQRQLASRSAGRLGTRRVDGIKLPSEPFEFAGAIVRPDMTISFPSGQVHKIGAKHIGMLREFDRNRGSLVLRDQLIHAAWGPDANTNSASVHQFLHVLRKLYKTEGIDLGEYIIAESKAGWRVASSPAETARI